MILFKNDEVIDFLTRPLTDFSALKMFKLQHQFNNFRRLLFAAPCTLIAFKSALWRGVNQAITLLHCHHIFFKTTDVYFAKDHYENYSPQMVYRSLKFGVLAHGLRG